MSINTSQDINNPENTRTFPIKPLFKISEQDQRINIPVVNI